MKRHKIRQDTDYYYAGELDLVDTGEPDENLIEFKAYSGGSVTIKVRDDELPTLRDACEAILNGMPEWRKPDLT